MQADFPYPASQEAQYLIHRLVYKMHSHSVDVAVTLGLDHSVNQVCTFTRKLIDHIAG